MKLNLEVKISRAAFGKFVAQLLKAGYVFEIKDVNADNTRCSVWVDGVAVAYRNEGGCWLYPVAFARYS